MPSQAASADLGAYLRRLPLALLAALGIWLLVRPVYSPVLCGASQFVARLFENPRASVVMLQGNDALLGRTDLRAGSGWLKLPLVQFHFNLVPFLGLVLALRLRFAGGRWRRLAIALGILAASHVFTLVLSLKLFEAFRMGPWSVANYSALERGLIRGLSYFMDIPVTFGLPLLLWVGAYPDQVFPLVGLAPAGKR